jgi:IMP and pyridine-specific 5'-nucleotidase
MEVGLTHASLKERDALIDFIRAEAVSRGDPAAAFASAQRILDDAADATGAAEANGEVPPPALSVTAPPLSSPRSPLSSPAPSSSVHTPPSPSSILAAPV